MTDNITFTSSVKEINAFKKKLSWGEVPTVYQMASSSLADLEGILSHGFRSAYTLLLDKHRWNLSLLEAYQDDKGNIQVKHQPQIVLRHCYDELHYELKCYPVVAGKVIHHDLLNHPDCPFLEWRVQLMQRLFRINNIIPFINFAMSQGDEADMALLKYAHYRVEELISILSESFKVIDIKGYNLASFWHEIKIRKHSTSALNK